MSGGRGLRVALAGATGSLGREVVAVLEERRFPVRELLPFASERSVGEDVEIDGECVPVASEAPPMRGLDLIVLCTPPSVALDLVREALRAEVPCIDCSGALADSPEVPLLISDLCGPSQAVRAPAVAVPTGPTQAWALVLSALQRAAGLRRVVGTVLQSAASAGRTGIEALSRETVALLGQCEPPAPEVFRAQVAFDCLPSAGGPPADETGATPGEAALSRDLGRLLEAPVSTAVTLVQVPTFVGDGSALAVQTERPLSAEQLSSVFEKAPGVEHWTRDDIGPSTRETAGRDVALVSRLRPDPSVRNGLLLWIAADAVRLAAANAVKLAEVRLRLN